MPFDPRVHVGVGLIIVNPLNRLLMIQRQGAHGAGTWGLVGGWVEYGETPGQAVVREAKEEVNITVEHKHLRPDGTSTHIFDSPVDHALTLFFQAPYNFDSMAPTINEPDKISKIAWVDYHHVDTLDLFPPFQQFIENGFRW